MTLYPDWYLQFCVVAVVAALIILAVATWRHRT